MGKLTFVLTFSDSVLVAFLLFAPKRQFLLFKTYILKKKISILPSFLVGFLVNISFRLYIGKWKAIKGVNEFFLFLHL